MSMLWFYQLLWVANIIVGVPVIVLIVRKYRD